MCVLCVLCVVCVWYVCVCVCVCFHFGWVIVLTGDRRQVTECHIIGWQTMPCEKIHHKWSGGCEHGRSRGYGCVCTNNTAGLLWISYWQKCNIQSNGLFSMWVVDSLQDACVEYINDTDQSDIFYLILDRTGGQFRRNWAWKRSRLFSFGPLNKSLFSQHGRTTTNRVAFTTGGQKLQDFLYVPWAERCGIYSVSGGICTESVGAHLISNTCFFHRFSVCGAPAERFLYGCLWGPTPERGVPWV